MTNIAIEELTRKRAELDAERAKHWEDFSAEIERLDIAIELLSGKPVKDVIQEYRYDDENPNYIKNTEDGI